MRSPPHHISAEEMQRSAEPFFSKNINTHWEAASEEQQTLERGLLFAQTQAFSLAAVSIETAILTAESMPTEAGSSALKRKYF